MEPVVEEFKAEVVEEEEVPVVEVLEDEVLVEVHGVVEEEKAGRTLSSSPTDMPAYSSPKEKNTCWSPKISYRANLCTAKNESQSKPAKAQKLNIECGIPSVVNWLLVFLEDLKKFTSNLAQRYYTWVQPVGLVLVMLRMSLAR